MDSTSLKAPKIRFPEFKDSWVSNEFSNLVDQGKAKYNPLIDQEDFESVELESLASETGRLIKTFNAKNLKSIKTKFTKGDVLFGKLRPYLKKYYYADFDGVCTSEIWVFKCKDIDSKYLFYLIQSPNFSKATSIQAGSKMPRAEWSVVASARFGVPNKEEQQKIASFLSIMDNKIALLQHKIELISNLRRGVVQQIFDKKLRFTDDNNPFPEWENKILGDFVIKYDEKSDKNNQYPVLTSSRRGIFLQKDYYSGNDIASKDTTGYNVVPRNYFTYRHMSDDLVFKFNINTIVDKGIVSTLYPVFKTKSIDNRFLLLKLNEGAEFRQLAQKQKQGGSRTYMYFTQLKKLIIQMPSLKEQEVIADFIDTIDKKIELEKVKLENTRKLKAGLLKGMLV